MATIVTREVGATAKSSPLSNTEIDANFLNIDADITLNDSTIAAINAKLNSYAIDATQASVAKALHRSPNTVTSTFIYDTSKDSDGGAWTEKCQHTSWYNETLSGNWLGPTFSAAAARAKSSGLIGPNLVANGTFESLTSDWIAANGAILSIENNRLKITNGIAAYAQANIDIPTISNKTYLLTFENIAGTAAVVVRASADNGTSWNLIPTNSGGDEYVFTATSSSSRIQFSLLSGSQGIFGYIDNVVVREVSSTPPLSNDYYQLTTDGKFYRTWKNLFWNPNKVTNSTWNDYGAVTTMQLNQGIAPDGTNTAILVTSGAASVSNRGFGTLTYSFYVKQGTSAGVRLDWAGVGGQPDWSFNFSTQILTVNSGWINPRVESIGNGWFRISATTATPTIRAVYYFNLGALATGETYYLWGAQAEAGTSATAFENPEVTSEVFRGNKRNFPKLAGIIADGNLTIYDLTEPNNPMWMRFVLNGSATTGSILTQLGAMSCFAMQGQIAIASNQDQGAYLNIDFAKDKATRKTSSTSWTGTFAGGIAERNITNLWRLGESGTIAGPRGYTVNMTILQDAPYDSITNLKNPTIAIGTNGGLSIIRHDNTILSLPAYSTIGGDLTIAGKLLLASRNAGDNAIFEAIGKDTVISSKSAGNDNWLATDITNPASVIAAGGGYHGGITTGILYNKFDRTRSATWTNSQTNGIHASIKSTYNTGHMIGDTRRTYLSDINVGNVSGTVLDRSYKNQLTNIIGVLTKSAVATNAQLVGYSGWSEGTYSVFFDGTGDNLETPNSAAFQFGTGDFTVEGWIYVTGALSGYRIIAQCAANNSWSTGWSLVIFNDRLNLWLNSNNIALSGAGTVLANTWQHVAVTRSGTTITLWINGSSVATGTSSDNLVPTRAMTIGAEASPFAYPFQGYISNVRIVKGTAVYTGNFTPPTAPLSPISGTSLLTCKDSTFKDNSTNNFAITVNGNSAISSLSPLGNYLREPYSSDLDFGTGDWSVSAWINIPVTLPSTTNLSIFGSNLITNGQFETNTSGWGTQYGNSGTISTVTGNGFTGNALRVDFTSTAFSSLTWPINFSWPINLDYRVAFKYRASTAFSSATDPGIAVSVNTSNAINYSKDLNALAWFSDSLRLGGNGNNGQWLEIDDVTLYYLMPFTIFERAFSSGSYIRLGVISSGKLVLTVFDGTTTRILSTTSAYNSATWLKVECNYQAGRLAILVNGQEVASSASVPLLTLNNSNAVLTIGNSYDTLCPFVGSVALLKLSATVPTLDQSLFMYEQEKQMFTSGAQVCLPDSNSILDIAYDDATDKWSVVSSANKSSWSGLVRTSTSAVPAGSFSRISAKSEIELTTRTTTNPGVDITVPALKLKNAFNKRNELINQVDDNLIILDYVGGFTANITNGSAVLASVTNQSIPIQTTLIGALVEGTGIPASTTLVASNHLSAASTATTTGLQINFRDFILPIGYETECVLVAGVMKQEGSTKDYTRLFDGFRETVRFAVAPGNTAWVQIRAVRTSQ